jgi:hypothetical protein
MVKMKMLQSMQTIRNLICRYFPRVVALLCIGFFFVAAYDYFHESPEQGLFKGHWAGCGNFRDIKHGEDMFQQNTLALSIHDTLSAKFIISGRLQISRKTYLAYVKDAKKILIELTPLQTYQNFFPPISEYVEVEDLERDAIDSTHGVTLKFKERELRADNDVEKYPFEKYRIGFSAQVKVVGLEGQRHHPVAMDVTIVNTNLSNPFIVRKIESVKEFMLSPDRESAATTRFKTNQCALIVERAIWYQAMVLFLIGLIFAPAVFLLYKDGTDPGVELIAALLGVVAIRSYLLGAPTDWNIYRIDVVFASAVLLTAVIPLWRLHKISKRRIG